MLTSRWHLAPLNPWEILFLVTTPGDITQGQASVTLFTQAARHSHTGDPR